MGKKTMGLHEARRPFTMDDGLNDMLDKSDPSGMVFYRVHSRWVREHPRLAEDPKGTSTLIKHELYDQPFLIDALESIKGFCETINASHTLNKNDEYEVGFNLLKLIHVQADLPGAREQTIEYFRLAAAFFESHTDNNAAIQYLNNRSKKGLRGAVDCRVWSPHAEKMVVDEVFTLRLNELIEKSPALQSHILGMARTINRMGPHSWLTLSERQIFGPNKGPRYLRLANEIRETHRERAPA